jgi:hypothetical protein
MAKLSSFTKAEQLALADVLTEFRDASPQEATTADQIGSSVANTEALKRDEIGTEPHFDDCPYAEQCEPRRRKLSTYRQYQPCHWRAWGDWRRCPIYRNGGNGR